MLNLSWLSFLLSWFKKKESKSYLLYIVLILLVSFGIYKVLDFNYQKGVEHTTILYETKLNKLKEEARTKELALQSEMEKVRKDAYEQNEKTNRIITTTNADVVRLQQQLKRAYASTAKSKSTQSTTGINTTNSQCWMVLSEAIGEYQKVAADADKLTQRLRISKEWADLVIQSNLKID